MRSHTPGQDRPTETLSIEQTGALEFSIMISISAIRHCLLGAAVLAVGVALFIALRSNGEVQAEQQRVTLHRIGGRPDAYRLQDAELELGC